MYNTLDLYGILEINSDASVDEIKRAYKKQAILHHPDRPNGNTEKFQTIALAYEILSDDEKRKAYDEYQSKDEINPIFRNIFDYFRQKNPLTGDIFVDIPDIDQFKFDDMSSEIDNLYEILITGDCSDPKLKPVLNSAIKLVDLWNN